MKKIALVLVSIFALSSCATIVNDPNTPVTLSFSDASSGTCNLSNKRGSWSCKVPGTFSIRRSDHNLRFDCTTDTGKKGFGNISSSIIFLIIFIRTIILSYKRVFCFLIELPYVA